MCNEFFFLMCREEISYTPKLGLLFAKSDNGGVSNVLFIGSCLGNYIQVLLNI